MAEDATEIGALKGIAAGLLALAGAISIEEAREMAGLPPMTERQRRDARELLRWNHDTGVVMPLAWAALFLGR